jgi:hypothetical protein
MALHSSYEESVEKTGLTRIANGEGQRALLLAVEDSDDVSLVASVPFFDDDDDDDDDAKEDNARNEDARNVGMDIEGLVISPENNAEDDAMMEEDNKDNEEQDVSAEVSLDASESSLMAEDLQEEEIQEDQMASVTNEKFNASVYYDIQEWEEEEVTDEEEEAERPKAALLHSRTQEALVDDDQELSSVAADENGRLKQELEEAKAVLKDMQENKKQMQEMINSLQVLVASRKLCSACRQPLIPPSPEEESESSRALLPIQKVPRSREEEVEVTTPTQPESKKLDTKATPKSMSVSIEDVAEKKKKKKSSKTKDKSSKTKKEESSKMKEESSKTKEKSSKTKEERAVTRRSKRERLSNSYLEKIGNSSFGPKIQIEEFVYNEKGEMVQHKKKSEFVRGGGAPGDITPVAKESKDRRSNVKDSLKSMLEVVDTPCL